MGVYDSLIKTGQRLIAKYGMEIDWVKPDLDTGLPLASYKPRMAFFPPDGNTARTLTALTGREAPTAAQMGLLAGGYPFEAEQTDEVTKSGNLLPIVAVSRIAPAGETVLTLVWFRR